ncbi:MAG TPA: serine/threonine-protein kinase [Planctomycetota bacterium]|nr:serine/threonine-protein kinase [Planctomycetota bacterium]
MTSSKCSVCGVLFEASAPEAAVASSEDTASTVAAATCSSCLQKLKSGTLPVTNRTTIMRPVGSLKVEGRPILAPSVDDDQPVVLRTPPPVIRPNPNPPAAGSGSSIVKVGDEPVKLSSAEAPAVARRFGNYEIVNEISRGSFGVVYKARQPGLDRVVALKVLLAGVHASGEAVARFQREAKAVARLKHPNIVPVYDIGMQDGHHYFAMEFVEGHALSTLVAQKQVTASDALSIAEQLADALESAHKAGVIHRDVKPSNILIDRDGMPHITDFGLAKQIDLDTKYTVSGTTLGTPAYMPPEQARGEIERIDARSDVYSIGAVMYEMLTGRTPFVGRSLLEVVVAVINEPLTPPRQLNPRIHRDIQTIVQKCLEKDPRQRYHSAADLRDDIRRFRSGEAIRARPAGLFRRTGRFIKRQSALIAAVCVVLVAVGFSAWRVRLSNQKVIEVVKENKELKQEVRKGKEVLWLPDWWFPMKRPSDLSTEELRTRYKMPVGRELSFQKLVPGKDSPDLVGDKPSLMPGTLMLVSPENCRFFGDVDADIVLQISENGIANGIRVGLQSSNSAREYDGIPYMLEYKNRRLRVLGPADLYGYTTSEGAKKQLKLEVKAEKEAAELLPGEYTLKLHREGVMLSFQLVGPQPSLNASVEIKDLNLSSWVFKTTQLCLRTPPGAGVDVVSAEVRKKFGGEEEEAFRFFYSGEYNGAEKGLEVLAEGEDLYKKALALYQLGMIQEICTPQQPFRDKYIQSIYALEQLLRDEKAADRARALKREVQIRKVISFAKDKNWAAFTEELKRACRSGDRIGEPLAWELQGVLEMAIKAAEKERSIDAGLCIIQRLGLRPGSARIGKAAAELAMLLVVEGSSRISDLIALHTAYPAPELKPAFFEAIHRAAQNNQVADGLLLLQYMENVATAEADQQMLAHVAGELAASALRMRKYGDASKVVTQVHAPIVFKSLATEMELRQKELATEDFADFVGVLLPSVSAHMPKDLETHKRIADACDKIARLLASIGRVSEMIELHKALRGTQNKSDARLASAFASTIQQLAASEDDARQDQALDLLRYCASHVVSGDPELRLAALALAKQQAGIDDNRYARILSIQKAYPAPELLELSLEVMLELNKRQLYAEAVVFYSQARVVFRDENGRLMASVITSLNNLRSDDQRAQLLTTMWHTVRGEFDAQKDEFAERRWRLDYGDVLFSLGLSDRAREVYQHVATAHKADPQAGAKASLRLATLVYLHPDTAQPGEFLQPMLANEELAAEFKLAARTLGAGEPLRADELDKELKALQPPLALSPAEWALFKGIRLRLEGRQAEAATVLNAASTLSSQNGPAWVLAPATKLLRTRDDPSVSPEVPPPGPPKIE